ncbi:hypothetical protein K470DRAFT_218135 [Piedraia hortae CBS 480.64]|uniref:Uncharacterized protein n=1 Tax=Piedraia hortae CBS 480.64 TaxID=1314780 RepID=A0A6A7BZH0_9PEZI|nr:hypothetical protein K470DRAFT_218135 [Piedraia hortae CBS 480.64]
MYSSRVAARSARTLAARRCNVRFASDATNAGRSGNAGGGFHPSVHGAIGGAVAGTLAFYLFYTTTGLRKATNAATQTKQYVDGAMENVKVQFKEKTPDTNEIIKTLKETAHKYARWLPGGREYVDKTFADLDTIRAKHGDEVDRIMREAYEELRDTSKNGLSLTTAAQVWDVLTKHMQRLGSLAVDAGQDILKNHPQLRDRFGNSFQHLQDLGNSVGPEAKKQVDDTWKQVQEILRQGINFGTLDRIQKLIQDKTQQVRKLSGQAFDKGMEQVKPMLDKNPQAKQLVEQNLDTLRSSNSVSEALSRIREAASSGSTLDLEKYIVHAKEKARTQFTSGGGLSDWLSQLPQGGRILPQLQKLKNAAETHGQDAQQLARETVDDLYSILERRAKQAEELANKASKQ